MMIYKRNHFNRNHIAHQAGQPVRRGRIDSDTRWLLGLCLARIGFTLIFHTYAATQPVLMRSWNLSARQAGWLHAGFYLGYLISLAGVGVLADRYGAKRMILLPGIVASGSAFLFAVFARDFYSGLVSYGTCALFLGGSYTPVLTVISQRIAVNRRGRAIGWHIAAGALGHALSLFLRGVMMAHYGWRSAFYMTACGPVVGTILMFRVLRHPPNVIVPRSPSPAEGNFWRAVLSNKGAMMMILGYTCHSWELLGMRAWLPAFLTAAVASQMGNGTQAASAGASIGAILLATSMVGNISGGTLSDRWGRPTVILLMSGLSLVCSFSLGWLVAMPFWLILLVGMLYSITSIGDSPVYSTALSERVPPRFLGAAYALRSVLGFGAGVVSPVVFGLVLDWSQGAAGTPRPLAGGLAFASLGLGGLFGLLGMLWRHWMSPRANRTGRGSCEMGLHQMVMRASRCATRRGAHSRTSAGQCDGLDLNRKGGLMFSKPVIRPSLSRDIPDITTIYAMHVREGVASFELTPPSETEMAQRREAVIAAGLPHLVAELDGRIVGYAYASPYRPRPAYDHTVENSVYIADGCQRRGVGRALMNAVILACEAAGKRQMIAVIGDSGNRASIELHSALGFQHTGRLHNVGFKHGRWLDTVLMQRHLGPGADTLPTS